MKENKSHNIHYNVIAGSLSLYSLDESSEDIDQYIMAVDTARKVHIDYLIDSEKAIYRITDDGDGFAHDQFANTDSIDISNESDLAHGRGMTMTHGIFDRVQYNKKGNQVLLI